MCYQIFLVSVAASAGTEQIKNVFYDDNFKCAKLDTLKT